MNCKASDDACRAELARLPLKNSIHYSCINFFNHIISSDKTLIYQIYNATRSSNPWIKKTKHLLQSLGYSYIFDNNVNFKHQLINIKQRIRDQNLQNQNSNICQSSKLNFFRTFYNMGKRPLYVDNLVNISERAAISKIRTSAHLLMIERGRHKNIPISERYCSVCKSGEIENEQHFLLHCSGYDSQRQILITKINKIVPGFSNLNTISRIKVILNSKSTLILRMSSSFISSCFKNRESLM